MYFKPEVAVTDWQDVLNFINSHPLGLLTTAIPFPGQSTIQASHLPFTFTSPYDTPTANPISVSHNTEGVFNLDSNTDLGTLQCHLARANPQAKALLSLSSTSKEEVLVVFGDSSNGDGYISPQWYKETKPRTGKVVPTWNYSELQLYGVATVLPSPHGIVTELTNLHEGRYVEKVGKGEGEEWRVSDAPKGYIDVLKRAIVGVEIKVTKIGFKLKMSRDKGEVDRKGVVEGLEGLKTEGAMRIAETVERLGAYKKT